MVQVCLQFLDQNGTDVEQVRANYHGTSRDDQGYCKTTLLEHKSGTFGIISTVLRAPLYLLRLDSESQKLTVALHRDFEVLNITLKYVLLISPNKNNAYYTKCS